MKFRRVFSAGLIVAGVFTAALAANHSASRTAELKARQVAPVHALTKIALYLGRAAADQKLHMIISFLPNNETAIAPLIADLYDPVSPRSSVAQPRGVGEAIRPFAERGGAGGRVAARIWPTGRANLG